MTSQDHCQNGESTYLAELFAEKEALIVDPSFKHSPILLAHEIDRIQTGSKKMIDLHINKPIKVETKVRLPVKEYPHFNFVGKIIGPKANTLKQLQDETGTKLIIQGAGSMRDKAKEEELRREGGKYAHLHEELHLLIEAYGPPAECYRRISLALYRLSDFFAQENIGDFAKLGIGRGRGMMLQGRAPHPGMAVAPGVSSPDRLPLSNPHVSWPTNSSPRMRANKPATTSSYTPQFNPLIFAPASSSSTSFSSNGNDCSPNLLSSQMFNPTDPCSSHLDYEGSITEEYFMGDRMPVRGHLRSSSRLHPY